MFEYSNLPLLIGKIDGELCLEFIQNCPKTKKGRLPPSPFCYPTGTYFFSAAARAANSSMIDFVSYKWMSRTILSPCQSMARCNGIT